MTYREPSYETVGDVGVITLDRPEAGNALTATTYRELEDAVREHRGDADIAAWTTAGLDATEIGLLTELYCGLRLRTYIRTRAWPRLPGLRPPRPGERRHPWEVLR